MRLGYIIGQWENPSEALKAGQIAKGGLKQQVLDTPAWKVLGTGLIILLAGTIVWLWHRLTRPPSLDHRPISYLRRLLTPIALVAVILGVGYVIEDQINVIGDFADVVGFATTIALYVAAAWALWLATLLVIEWIIASPAIPDEGLDANLLRLLGRVVGIFAIAMVAAHGGQQLSIQKSCQSSSPHKRNSCFG